MLTLIGELLPQAVAFAINPTSVVVMVLLLTTPRPMRVALPFLAGWLASCLVIVITFVLLGGRSVASIPPHVGAWIKIGLGVLFLLLAVLEWVHRPKAGTARPAGQAVGEGRRHHPRGRRSRSPRCCGSRT